MTTEMNESDEKFEMDENDLTLMTNYTKGPFTNRIKIVEDRINKTLKRLKSKATIETQFGILPPSEWDKERDQKLGDYYIVGIVEDILKRPDKEIPFYTLDLEHQGKYVVKLCEELAVSDVEKGMRVAANRQKFDITIPLNPAIDPIVQTMEVEERPNVTYSDVGGCDKQIDLLREMIELPLLHPEKFQDLGVEAPKGVLFYGPPGTGKTLLARAVANRTESTFIRVNGTQLLQRYVGEGARIVRELFKFARTKKSCIIFFDEVDSFGQTRFAGADGCNKGVETVMLELITQLDGFETRGNIKVIMATNRPDTLDPALLRPGRLDRKIQIDVPGIDGRKKIFEIHTRTMSLDRGIRFELLARLCPCSTGADIRSVCTEAGIIALRQRKKSISEKDFLEAINKVILGYSKFSATPQYLQYN